MMLQNARFPFSFCFFILISVSFSNGQRQPMLDVNPKIIHKNFQWLQLFCQVSPMNESESFVSIAITKTQNKTTQYVAKLLGVNKIEKIDLDDRDEARGQIDNKHGGYFLVQIRKPVKNNHGVYKCETKFKSAISKQEIEISREVRVEYMPESTLTNSDVLAIMNAQYRVFTTIYRYNDLKYSSGIAEINKEKQEINKIKSGMNKNEKKMRKFDKVLKKIRKLADNQDNLEKQHKQFKKELKKIKRNKRKEKKTNRRSKNNNDRNAVNKYGAVVDKLSKVTGVGMFDFYNSSLAPYFSLPKVKVAILRRMSASVDFNQNFLSYEYGFGDPGENFWIGLKTMHLLTRVGNTELHVTMVNGKGKFIKLTYREFKVSDKKSGYKLTVSGYIGGVKYDSLKDDSGAGFTTKDKDTDTSRSNCAKKCWGGWWYKNCSSAHVTGKYGINDEIRGIKWKRFTSRRTSITYLEFLIAIS